MQREASAGPPPWGGPVFAWAVVSGGHGPVTP